MKVLHSQDTQEKDPAFSFDRKIVETRFLYKKKQKDVGNYWEEDEALGNQDDEELQTWHDEEVYQDEGDADPDDEGISDSAVGVAAWDPTPSYSDDGYELFPMTLVQEASPIDLIGTGVVERGDEVHLHGDGRVIHDQLRLPRRGDRNLLFNVKTSSWMMTTLTSDKIKYYRKIGSFFKV